MKIHRTGAEKRGLYDSMMAGLSRRLRHRLGESQESKSFDAAKRYLVSRMKDWDADRVDRFLRIRIRETFPELRTKAGGKFLYGTVRLWFDSEIEYEGDFSDMNTILGIISSPRYIDEYDRNFNGESFKTLKTRFLRIAKENHYADRRALYSEKFTGLEGYRIVRVPDFETAHKYARFTNPDDPWCLCEKREHFDNYTCDGLYTVYFCLRNGYRMASKPDDPSPEAPLDRYGLSMFCVIVNDRGWLSHCTTRYNHRCGGTDHAMTTRQISDTLGENFYELFRHVPPTAGDGSPAVTPRNAQKFIDSGMSPADAFDSVREIDSRRSIVTLAGKQSVLHEGRLFEDGDVWFSSVRESGYGFLYGLKNNIVLIIDEDNEFVDYSQFSALKRFRDGDYLLLELDGEYKIFDTLAVRVCNPEAYYSAVKRLTGDRFAGERDGRRWLLNAQDGTETPVDFDFVRCLDGDVWEVDRNGVAMLYDLSTGKLTKKQQS